MHVQLASGGGRRGARKGDAAAIVQRNALRAVCAILDAFHFVPRGSRLHAAPLLSSAKVKASLAVETANVGDDGCIAERKGGSVGIANGAHAAGMPRSLKGD
jgi:hypothetical protein